MKKVKYSNMGLFLILISSLLMSKIEAKVNGNKRVREGNTFDLIVNSHADLEGA